MTKAASGREAQGPCTDPGRRKGNNPEGNRTGGKWEGEGEAATEKKKRCEIICPEFVFMKI